MSSVEQCRRYGHSRYDDEQKEKNRNDEPDVDTVAVGRVRCQPARRRVAAGIGAKL